MSDEKEYEVGYGKPPRETQFKKGAPSPNPSGRPRKTLMFLDHFEAELQAKVPITENGRGRRPTKEKLIAKRLVNGAVQGVPAMMKQTQTLLMLLDERRRGQVEALSPRERDRLDKAVMATILGFLPEDDDEAKGGGS